MKPPPLPLPPSNRSCPSYSLRSSWLQPVWCPKRSVLRFALCSSPSLFEALHERHTFSTLHSAKMGNYPPPPPLPNFFMFGFRIATHKHEVEKRDRKRWLAPTHTSNDVKICMLQRPFFYDRLYCCLNYFFFLFFCHKHDWNYTSCSYHQYAPIKTHILLSVVLGWTCLYHFSASLSTFVSFLCRPWEYKRVLRDTSS